MAKNYKIIIWHGIVAAISYGFWFDVAKWFEALRLEKGFTSYAVITFAFMVSLVALGFILFERKWLVLSLTGIIGATFVLNFGWSELNLIGLLILFLCAFKSYLDIMSEFQQRIKIDLNEILRHSIFTFILGLFVLISFAAYQNPAFEQFSKFDQLPDQTEQYIKVVAENTIGHKIEGSEKEKQLILNKVSSEAYWQINNIVKPYFKYAPPLLAFTLFLILWGLGWIFIWLSLWTGMLLFFIMKKVGFVKIEEKETKAEVLAI